MNALRTFVRSVIAEMAAHTAATIPQSFALFVDDYSIKGMVYFILVDEAKSGKDSVIGYFSIAGYPRGRWYAGTVWADHGYGPLLYRAAMEYATTHGKGLRQNKHGATSDEAQAVWDMFEKQAGKSAGVGRAWDKESYETFYTLQPGSSDLEELVSRGHVSYPNEEDYGEFVYSVK